MLGALAMVSLREWKQRKLRLILTILGIALGVAAFFAVITANLTLVESLKATVEKLAGKATLQITSGETGFPQKFLEIAKSTEGVRLAEPVIETIAQTGNNQNLFVIGLDTASDLELHSDVVPEQNISIANPLAFIDKPDSIAVSRTFADNNDLKEGDSLELFVQETKKKFTVRGFFKPEGAAEIFGGNVAVIDIYAAQEIFGRGSLIDRIDILTAENASIDDVKARLRKLLPNGIDISSPSTRGEGLENSVSSVNLGMTIMSFMALTIGVFLIFNSFYISVNQRSKEIGILRALGASGKQTQAMFLGEAVILGLVGSVIGVGAGYFLAIAAVKIMESVAATSYGMVTSSQMPPFRLDYMIAAILIGLLSSMVAAWIPARDASRLDPIAALHNIETRNKESLISHTRIFAGIFSIMLGLALSAFSVPKMGSMIPLFYWIFAILGMILLLPKMISISAVLLRPLMNRLFGIEGVIAVDTMARAPRRTSATVGALMMGLAFVFANGALIKSQKAAIVRTLERSVNVDFFVTTSDQIRSRTYHFSEETSAKIAAIKGAKRVENLRVTSVNYKGSDVALLAEDMNGWIERSPELLLRGNASAVKREMAAGEGFFVSENFARKYEMAVGDLMTVESPTGAITRKILGILEYHQSENGTIFIERELYKKFWIDNYVDYILIRLDPATDRSEFKASLEKTISKEQQAFIYSQEEYQNWVTSLIDQFFTLNYLQMVIAIVVAGLGLINTMVISVAERKREIGVLRAIGGLKGQIRKMILLESVSISIVGIITGSIAGLLQAYCTINISIIVITGFTLPFKFPFALLGLSIPVVIIVALISAWVPASRAANLEIAEAIEYE